MYLKKFKTLILILAVTAGINVFASTSGYTVVSANGVQTQSASKAYTTVNPLDIVARPNFYLNKNVGATVVWGKLYKKECFKTIRFPEGKIYEDEYVSYKVLFNYTKVAVVEAPLYAYFQNPESFMHSKWNRKKLDGLKALEMQMEFFKKRNLQEIYIDRVRVYIYFSANQYKQCRSVPSMIWISLGLKWKATAKMIIYHKRKILDRKMELYIAEIFFPHLMYVYWLMRALKSKLKNEGLSATIFSVVRYFKNK